MYTNLYYNNGRWYALVDGTMHIPSWRFSRNQVGAILLQFGNGLTDPWLADGTGCAEESVQENTNS